MYTQEDMREACALLRKRWLITALPAGALLLAAVAVFVAGQLARSETLWMVTAALTIVGGAYFAFLYGVYVKPARVYRMHVYYMLRGRLRETTGYFKSFSEDVSDRDGLECHAMLLNVGEKDDPEDDRLFYYDALKPRPGMALGTRVTVQSNDMKVARICVAE